jgi:general secretion pathway protein L
LNIELLKELTAILPDATWVEQLEISGNEIRVRGQSPTASALLGLMEASKLFQNATFLSPITAGAAGKDRFYLSAQIAREP